jgi:hypothetical protein
VAVAQEFTIRTCEALANGDEIEAWHNGRLIHRGRVSQTVPSMGMFWIVCARTGARKLVDLEASEICRVASPSQLDAGETGNDVGMIGPKPLTVAF